MGEVSDRKKAPKVNKEIDRELSDVEFEESGDKSQTTNGGGRPIPPTQSEPKEFSDFLDLSKLQFGQKLIGWCIFLIVALSLISYFCRGVSSGTAELRAAIEMLKLVTTTALGFVFAKIQPARNFEASPGS